MLTTVSGGRVTPIGREPELAALLGFLEPHAPARALALYGGPGDRQDDALGGRYRRCARPRFRVLPARASGADARLAFAAADRSPRRCRRRRTRAPGGSATAGARGRRPARRPGRSAARAPGDRARPSQRPAPLGRLPPAADRDRRRPVARPALAGSAGVCRAAAGVARRAASCSRHAPAVPRRSSMRSAPRAGTSRPRPAEPRRDSATAARAARAEPSAATAAAPGRFDAGQSTVRAGARPSLVERGLPAPGDELPVPDTIEDLLGTRVGRLPAPVRRAAARARARSRPQRVAAVHDRRTRAPSTMRSTPVSWSSSARPCSRRPPVARRRRAEAVASGTRTPRAASRARRGGRRRRVAGPTSRPCHPRPGRAARRDWWPRPLPGPPPAGAAARPSVLGEHALRLTPAGVGGTSRPAARARRTTWMSRARGSG